MGSELFVESILDGVKEHRAHIGVLGLGYVGLTLAVEWAQAGFSVTGFDLDAERIACCLAGNSWVPFIDGDLLKNLVMRHLLTATESMATLVEMDAIIICVPTPLQLSKEPDLAPLAQAVRDVSSSLRRGQIIVVESTTYPGTCEDVVLPLLATNGLVVGEDYFLAYSPERLNPGHEQFSLRSTPKIVSGITANCMAVVTELYSHIVGTLIPVSSTRAAEMVKLIENTFRAVNIGLMNEMAVMGRLLGIDIWEVAQAAGTKPYGYMSFMPGPGVGGHCIPVDPHYLAYKARTLGFNSRLIAAASEANDYMPHYVVDRVTLLLNDRNKCLNGAKILILGVAYKGGTNDVRESPALQIMNMLLERNAEVCYHDPYVSRIAISEEIGQSVALEPGIVRQMDCVILVTDHGINYDIVVSNAQLIFDTRDALASYSSTCHNIYKL